MGSDFELRQIAKPPRPFTPLRPPGISESRQKQKKARVQYGAWYLKPSKWKVKNRSVQKSSNSRMLWVVESSKSEKAAQA